MRSLVLLLTLPLLFACSGEKEAPKEHAPVKDEVIEVIHENTSTFDSDKVLFNYIKQVCLESPSFTHAPTPPSGVSDEDAGYVTGVLIASEACERG